MLLVVLFPLLFSSAAAVGKSPALAPAPPEPVPQSLKVNRGETIDVPLGIYGSRNQTLEFRIQTHPGAGKLSAIKTVAPERATVRYTPPADLAVTSAKFSYAVRSNEGVSGAVEVSIKIIDAPPKLDAPAESNFPRTLIGAESAREIVVTNAGGGIAEGMLETSNPWRLEGSRTYRLGAGEKRTFKIVFAPELSGKESGHAQFTSQPERPISLTGEAVFPIAFSPDAVELRHEAAEPVRAGSFEVKNNTGDQQTLKFVADDRLQFPRELPLAADATATITVRTAPDDVAPLDAEIHLNPARAGASIAVRFAAVGPIFRVAQKSVNFGTASAGVTARNFIEIANVGGTAGTASLEADPPFFVVEKSVFLDATKTTKVAVAFDAQSPGSYHSELRLQAHSGPIAVPLTAVVSIAGADARIPKLIPISGSPRRSDDAAESAPIGIEHAPAVHIANLTPTSTEITWPKAGLGSARYIAEWRQLALTDGELGIAWRAFPNTAFDIKDTTVTATFSGLQPQTLYILRVRSVNAAGDISDLAIPVQFATPAKPPFIKITLLRVLMFALILCITGAVWQKMRSPRALG